MEQQAPRNPEYLDSSVETRKAPMNFDAIYGWFLVIWRIAYFGLAIGAYYNISLANDFASSLARFVIIWELSSLLWVSLESVLLQRLGFRGPGWWAGQFGIQAVLFLGKVVAFLLCLVNWAVPYMHRGRYDTFQSAVAYEEDVLAASPNANSTIVARDMLSGITEIHSTSAKIDGGCKRSDSIIPEYRFRATWLISVIMAWWTFLIVATTLWRCKARKFETLLEFETVAAARAEAFNEGVMAGREQERRARAAWQAGGDPDEPRPPQFGAQSFYGVGSR